MGTLRCVQAIVKMQTLVRARHARLSGNGSFTENIISGKDEKDVHNPKIMVMHLNLNKQCHPKLPTLLISILLYYTVLDAIGISCLLGSMSCDPCVKMLPVA